jgi:hypothetical protein
MQNESIGFFKRIPRTAFIAVAVFAVPVVLACLFFLFLNMFRGPSPAAKAAAINLAALPDDPALLSGIREDMRTNGIDVGGVNLRIWAARATRPDVLFNVAPPSTGKDWSWRLTQDGRCALAVSVQSTGNGSREVGLYDLIGEKWLWVQPMPWPDQPDQPVRVGDRLLVRYAKNGSLFALEISASGRITSIEPLGRGHIPSPAEPQPDPRFPGTPVALHGGVFFTSGAGGGLAGYAANPLPGLRQIAKIDDRTAFSGNGLLRFDVDGGSIRVGDALTGTALLQVNAWPNTTNTTVLATRANENGSLFTVFLQTDFGGRPAVSRKWTATLDTASGRVSRSFDTDVSLPAPETFAASAASPDGNWELAAGISNTLSIVSCTSSSVVAHVSIPADAVKFLPVGNHALLRSKGACWILDFATARHYADWLANLSAGTNTLPADLVAKQELQNMKDEAYYSFSTTSEDIAKLTNGTALAELQATAKPSRAPAYLALKAQIFAANGAWPYAVRWMCEMQSLQESDMRAPRVNTFLLARLAVLAGDTDTVRDCCRREYAALSYSSSEDARMVMFHIRALFAQAQAR